MDYLSIGKSNLKSNRTADKKKQTWGSKKHKTDLIKMWTLDKPNEKQNPLLPLNEYGPHFQESSSFSCSRKKTSFCKLSMDQTWNLGI